MSKSISPMLFLKSGAKLVPASPRSHRSDEFAAGYSSAVCSPAWPASASPDGFHLPAGGSYLSTVSFGKISKLDSKARTRQNINIRGGPNQSIELGQTGVSNSAFSRPNGCWTRFLPATGCLRHPFRLLRATAERRPSQVTRKGATARCFRCPGIRFIRAPGKRS
jgi:hypothetical protein